MRSTARAGEPSRSQTAPARGFDQRTRALLEGPIARTLLRLAMPNMLVMVVQASVGLIETYFIGWLGTAALAGVALVFPAVMLMQMMSAGAMGGGISSAVARARRRAPPRRRCVGAPRAGDRRPFRLGLCDRHAGRRPLDLPCDGRLRSVARRGVDLFRRRLFRRGPGLGVQLARQCDPRHRQHGGPGARHLRRRRRAVAVVPLPDPRLGTVPAARRRRRPPARWWRITPSAASRWPVICGPGGRSSVRPSAVSGFAGRCSAASCGSAGSRR